MHDIRALEKIKKAARNIVNGVLSNTGIETRYINIPRFKLFRLAFFLLMIELLVFTCFYGIFILVSIFFAIYFGYLYKKFIQIWKKFYSQWSLHILALLSTVPAYFLGILIRFLIKL